MSSRYDILACFLLAITVQTAPQASTGFLNNFFGQQTSSSGRQQFNTGVPVGQCQATKNDMLGPYYAAGAPFTNGTVCTGRSDLTITGGVFDRDCSTVVRNAKLFLWQANPEGLYSVVNGNTNGNFDCRAIVQATNGRFNIRTTYPGSYPGRPRHLHFVIQAPGYRQLITQLYFSDDTLRFELPADQCFNCRENTLTMMVNGEPSFDGSTMRSGTWNIYLEKLIT